MAYFNKCLVGICVVCSWILNSCTTDVPIEYESLHIEGVTWACNVSTSYAHFGASNEFEEQWEVRIPVSDGDLLYMWDDNDMELYYRYSAEDGNHLVVSRDTLKPELVFVNGALSQIKLKDEKSCQTLAYELSTQPEQIRGPLLICDTITPEMIRELKESEPLLKGSGIAIETAASSLLFNEMISLCRPGWIVLHTLLLDQDTDPITGFETPELLWITGDLTEFSGTIKQCTNLESLIIGEWKPEGIEPVSLSGLNKLHTLTLGECGIRDLSGIEFPRSLQRLHLVACDTLTDISKISEFLHLKSLGLAGSNQVTSLKSISGLEQLNRISFPANSSQEDFESVLGRTQSLEVVELLQCPQVLDLSLLREQENLKFLILQTDTIFPEHLEMLDQLELIILGKEIFEKSPDLISELRTQLPDTQIVPGSGLCLGSGWLLLILPLIIVSRILFRKS
jgi:hypothetical protein